MRRFVRTDINRHFTAIAAGAFPCGRNASGSVECWNPNEDSESSKAESDGWSTLLEGDFRDFSAASYVCAISDNRSIRCEEFDSGSTRYGQTSPPDGSFRSVTTALYHSCAIRTDGTVECWGLGTDPERREPPKTGELPDFRLDYDQASPPGGDFKEISAGTWHTCGIRDDDSIVCWGLGSDPNRREGKSEQAEGVPGEARIDYDQAVPPGS